MAVVIHNVSESYNREYGKGLQVYNLMINHTFKCRFEHTFEDGLAMCLRRAADAFDMKELDENDKN